MKVKVTKATITGNFKDEVVEMDDKQAAKFIAVGLAVEVKEEPKKEVESLD